MLGGGGYPLYFTTNSRQICENLWLGLKGHDPWTLPLTSYVFKKLFFKFCHVLTLSIFLPRRFLHLSYVVQRYSNPCRGGSKRSGRCRGVTLLREAASRGLSALIYLYLHLWFVCRAAFHSALNAMQNSMVRDSRNNLVSEYRLIISLHQFRLAPGAHNGPAFLPWHREYIYRSHLLHSYFNPRGCSKRGPGGPHFTPPRGVMLCG